MPESSMAGDTPPDTLFDELRVLAESAVLPFDNRSREEVALRLAGYDDRQVTKLLAQMDGQPEPSFRRVA